MQKINEEEIRRAVAKREQIRLRSYAMMDETEEALKEILALVLNAYNSLHLMEAVYTSLKELAINAVKANMKRVVFQKHKLNIDHPPDLEYGMGLFRERLEGGDLEGFAREARKMGYAIMIDFFPEEDCVVVEIRNNALMTSDENKRLRGKLAKSMTYEDIAQFYMDFADNTEGAGLGMTMITVMLRENNIDPHCFTVFSRDIYTVARLEVPMSDDYIPRRKRFARANS